MIYDPFLRDGLLFSSLVLPHLDDHHLLRRDAERGELVKLRRGAFVLRDRWDASDPREQHILRVRAALAVAQRPVLVAGFSAGALWGMPIGRAWPSDVTLLDEWTGGGRSEPGVRKTAAGFSTALPTVREGLPCTTLARTVLDVARKVPFAEAVGSIDWVLRAGGPHPLSKEDLLADLRRMRPRTGRRHLERVIAFADPASDNYGESTCRAVMHELGFEAPELQAEFRDAEGRMLADFTWRRYSVIAEFDGKQKYTDPRFTDGAPDDVLWREKRREDRLRRKGFVVVRILWSHVQHPERLAELLREAGVPRRGR